MKGLRTCWFCAIAWWVSSGLALADGVMRDGQGAVSVGRGGTNLGFADNGAILFDNPAGMINFPGSGLMDCSLDNLVVTADYSDPENSTDADLAVYPLGYFAMMQKSGDGRLAYGLGVFAPAGFGANYDMINTGVAPPRIEYEYMSFGALVRVLPALAYQVNDRLAIGGTLGVAASHTELEGPFFTQGGPAPGTPTLMDLKANGATLSWSLGLQYQLTDDTVIGAAYSNENNFDLEGDAFVSIAGISSSFDLDADLSWPQSAGVGVQHRLSDYQRMGVDVIWYDWSGAFDSLDIALTNPTNPQFALNFGDQVNDRLPLRWRDSVSLRLGFEQLLSWDAVVRAGYVYHRNPVPAGTLTPFIPGIMEHAFSVGYGKFWEDHSFNLAYSYAFGPSQSVSTSDLQGGDFNNSRMEAAAHFMMLTFARWW